MEDRRFIVWVALAALVLADLFLWSRIVFGDLKSGAYLSFLDVGQGDASLLEFSEGARVLIDAGPDASVVSALERTLPKGSKRLDLAIITHPETDHFNGFKYALEQDYFIGAFIINGRDNPDSSQWADLLEIAKSKEIPLITLGAGDSIRQGSGRLDIISPDAGLVSSRELNDSSLVIKARTPDLSALFTGDIGFSVESKILATYDIEADILKIGHHGSKYSTSARFLSAVKPVIALIGVGSRNPYGHPAPEVVSGLDDFKIDFFRTDVNGDVVLRPSAGKISVSTSLVSDS